MGRRLAHELRELVPAVLFFFVALMLIMVLFKLFVSQYSIEFYAFSKAAIGALIVGKVVLLMDWVESSHRASSLPRAAVIACKTLLYGIGVVVLGIGDRLIHSYRVAGSLRGGIDLIIASARLDHFLGCVLLITMILVAYFVMQEIDHAMGKGALFKLFFARPRLE